MGGRPNKIETLLLEYAAHKSDPVFDLEIDGPRVEQLASAAGYGTFNLYAAVRRLADKNYLHRLQNGTYVVRDQPTRSARLWSLDPVAEAVFRRLNHDYYISWHAALWHYGLIDQQSRRISVAVRKWKRPVVIGESRLEFVRVSASKFFEAPSLIDDLEWPVKMATVARAIVDSFDRPELVGPPPVIVEALRRASQDGRLQPSELVRETLTLGSPTLNRRVGYFMDLLQIPGTDELALRVGRGYAEPLFRGREPQEKLDVDPRWRVYLDPGLITTALELK